jgi:lysophospholipase L1-like esterase
LTPLLARALFWALLPVTASQGLWLRRRATRLPGAAGARAGVIGAGEDYHLLAIGDSIIEGVGAGRVEASLPVQFASRLAEAAGRRIHWRIEGCSGHGIRDVIERLDALQHDAPIDLVLVSVGVNDVTGLSSTRSWRRNVHILLGRIRSRWPAARILFTGLPPMGSFPLPPQPLRFSLGLRAATLDRIASAVIARHPGAVHVMTHIDPEHHDFCEDGFHPAPESCTLWARELAALHTGRLNT